MEKSEWQELNRLLSKALVEGAGFYEPEDLATLELARDCVVGFIEAPL